MYYAIVWCEEKRWGYCIIDEGYLKEEDRLQIERAKEEENRGNIRVLTGDKLEKLEKQAAALLKQLCKENGVEIER